MRALGEAVGVDADDVVRREASLVVAGRANPIVHP